MNEIIMNKIMANKKLVIAVICALVAIILCVSLGVVLSGKMADASGTENTQESETFGTEVFMDTQMQETENTEVGEVVTLMPVKVIASSIEKDLKIKLLDESDNRIIGQNFIITVTFQKTGEAKEYSDHDMDGIINIKGLEPGEYMVQLHEIEGFNIIQNNILATAKDKIAYEKVEIKNEIKDESEINETEKAPDNGESTRNEIKDTLPYLEKDVLVDEVSKDKVDMSAFAVAKVSEDKDIEQFDGVIISLPQAATLYTSGKADSKTLPLIFDLTDTEGIVKDIQWKFDSTVIDCVVADDKKSASLTMKSEGVTIVSVEVTYEEQISTSENPKTATVECVVSVENQPDSQTQLKDTDGNLLYLDKEAMVLATPVNYASAEKFYTNPRYVGWWEIGEKSFYFKEDYTPATGKQIIGGVEYEFDETGCLITKERTIGIDVSKWNGEIDWAAVANSPANIDFAIIRCGNRFGKSGDIAVDPYFKKNIEGAIKNGIKVGVYFYSQAITKAEAVEEASAALELVKGYNLQLPIYIDTENLDGGRANKLSKEERTEIIKTFCEVIKNAGYKPGVYSGKWWYMNKINVSEIEQYHIWVAQYNTTCSYPGRYDIWQYTESGKIPGINGNVDMNICYRTYY